MDKIYILSIESATPVCSVALHQNGALIALAETNEDKSHATSLLAFCDEVLEKGGITYQDLSAIAVSGGPGSYTGLRIGTSTAKGFCYAMSIPLIDVPTLDALCLNASQKYPNTQVCAMVDARRLEVYAMVKNKQSLVLDTQPIVVDTFDWTEIVATPTVFVGNGALKCVDFIQGDNLIFDGEVLPSALVIGVLAYQKFMAKEFADVAYYEPFYLKEFQVTASKKNILC